MLHLEYEDEELLDKSCNELVLRINRLVGKWQKELHKADADLPDGVDSCVILAALTKLMGCTVAFLFGTEVPPDSFFKEVVTEVKLQQAEFHAHKSRTRH